MGQKTVLDALESVCNVDVDSVDPRIATALPFKPHNRMLIGSLSLFGSIEGY